MPHADERLTPSPGRRIEPASDAAPPRPSAPRASRYRPPAWRSRAVWRVLLALALLAGVLLVAFRRPLAEAIWPQTRIQRLLDQAEAALVAGRLQAPDGDGARQLFEAAQALDGDRSEAARGLQRVAQAALAQAGDALQANRFEEARRGIALARELQAPRAQVQAVEARLRAREAEYAGIDAMLLAAQRAAEADRLLEGEDAALPLYRRVLALQPDRLEALEGREDALSDVLQQARRALGRGDMALAAGLVAQARDFDAGHVDLPQAQAELARALDARRAQAAKELRRGRLEAAQAAYEAVVAAAPDDAAARQGLVQVGQAYARDAGRKAEDFQFAQAAAGLDRARLLAPQSAELADAERRLERSRQARSRLSSGLPAHERDRQVQALLDAMAQAEARGQWITPPGESAYDRLRAAQALAPESPAVRQAATRLLPAVSRCLDDELRANRIRRAQACLQAWQTVQPGDVALPDARRRLAEKWIAVGLERLEAGDVAFAGQALQEARRLDARAAGLDAMQERVRTAQTVPVP